jgi:general secretion pathway protein G
VLGILALLAGIGAPQVIRYLGTAKSETAKTQISSLAGAVELYYLDVGVYPPPEVGLKALIEAPPQIADWKGPYVKKSGALTDPWGKPYMYRFPGQYGAFDIFSLGRDNQVGGTGEDKDIASW